MRKCDSYITCSGYKYAPEQFKAYRVTGFSNGNRNIPIYEEIILSPDEKQECGYKLCTEGKPAAIAKLKSIMRERERKTKKSISYGYRLVDDKKRFAFIPGYGVPYDAPMSRKLDTYRKVKANMEYLNWEHVSFIEAKLGAGYSVESKTEHKEKIDKNAPMMF